MDYQEVGLRCGNRSIDRPVPRGTASPVAWWIRPALDVLLPEKSRHR